MTFPVVGSNIPSTYQISNSLRFNDNDSAYLNLSTSGSPTSSKKCTFSFWVKRGNLGITNTFFSAGSSEDRIGFSSVTIGTDSVEFVFNNTGSGAFFTSDNGSFIKYRDTSAWYHFVVAIDTTLATADDRLKFYQNGNLIPHDNAISGSSAVSGVPITQNYDLQFLTSGNNFSVGRNTDGSGEYLDGYLAEIHFIDGQQLAPTDFAEADADSGIWKPLSYSGSYGNYGFYLKFNNAGNMGEDSSGNDNTFTPTNLSGTTDVTTDTPTNNFATLNPLSDSGATLSEGNTQGINAPSSATSTIAPTSGKWYVEFQNSGLQNSSIGLVNLDAWASTTDIYPFAQAAAVLIESFSNYNVTYAGTGGGTTLQTGTQYNLSKYGYAFDLDNGDVYVSADGNWYGGSDFDQASFSNAVAVTTDIPINTPMAFFARGSFVNAYYVNFGNPPTSYSISSGNSDENGYGNFEYAPPSGYLALCTQNLATVLSPTIDDGSQYFNTILYTGTGTTQSITGVGFQPDLVWLKARTSPYYHNWYDSNRGGTKAIFSNSTFAEATDAGNLQTFISDGFTADGFLGTNGSGVSYVAWNWKANAGSTSSNTDGSITSTVQANPTAGFSIITYTGNGTSGATIGHGLGKVPKMIIQKNRERNDYNWQVYHAGVSSDPETDFLRLNTYAAVADDATVWNDTAPTSSVITLGNSIGGNASGEGIIVYAFAEIEGYSKFGKYTGNGSTDGAFIYTGFRPAFVIIKRTDSSGVWTLIDTTRKNYNFNDTRVHPNLPDAEYSGDGYGWDMLSNGFKQRSTSLEFNGSGASFIYMAFAENPFVTSGAVPVTAR